MQFVMFTKHLSEFSIEEAARQAGAIGFSGLDLTVRPGGHVLPEQAATLPAAVKSVQALGYGVPLITTNVTRADEPYARDIFRAAAAAGIGDIKLGYWRYRGFGKLRAQLDEVRPWLDGLEALAGQTGVRANIHVHCGDCLSADAGILWSLLRDHDPARLGAYADPGHMTVEGGASGWKMGLDLLTPWVNVVAVKAMAWVHEYDAELCQERWDWRLVPLRQGTVPWFEVFRYLKQIGYDGVVSLHSEYQTGHSVRQMTTEELLLQTAEDLAFIKTAARRACSESEPRA